VKSIKHHIHGKLFVKDEHGALLLIDSQPAVKSVNSIHLRFAILIKGIEQPIFPAFILDDWGGEVKGLAIYEWIREFGDMFPRAELFGFEMDGRETQRFLRELEIHSRLLCYAYPDQNSLLSEGVLVSDFLLPDESVSVPIKIERPSQVNRPLRSSRGNWWRVNPVTTSFDPSSSLT